jgi:hypothetical protein
VKTFPRKYRRFTGALVLVLTGVGCVIPVVNVPSVPEYCGKDVQCLSDAAECSNSSNSQGAMIKCMRDKGYTYPKASPTPTPTP